MFLFFLLAQPYWQNTTRVVKHCYQDVMLVLFLLLFYNICQYVWSVAVTDIFLFVSTCKYFWLIWKLNINNFKKCFMQCICFLTILKIFSLMHKLLHNELDSSSWQNSYLHAISRKALCKYALLKLYTTHFYKTHYDISMSYLILKKMRKLSDNDFYIYISLKKFF